MKPFKILLISSCFSILAFGQNLVPNPSFESVSSCPNNYNQVSGATGWLPSSNNNNPTFHTDYCNACGTSLFQIPANTWGNQAAATGTGYMAEVTMDPGSQQDYRENIYTQLTTPLVIGSSYFVSMKVSHTDNSQNASNNFGAKFSTVPDFPVNNISHVYSSSIITDKVNWTTISGCFVADSAYKYIGLGNFFTDANTLTQQSCSGCQWPLYGYYVDDISVTPFSVNTSGNTTLCSGASATLSASGGTSYQWNSGLTTSSIVVSPTTTTTYSVTVTDVVTGCSGFSTVDVTVTTLTLDPGATQTICAGDSCQLSIGGAVSTYTWSPTSSLNNANIQSPIAFPASGTTYTVTTINSAGCLAIDSQSVIVYPAPATPTISVNVNVLMSSSSLGNQWYLNGGIIQGAISQFYTAAQSGFYHVMVTDANGCTAISATSNFTFMGISESNSSISFSFFPNPNNGNFELNISSLNQKEIIILLTTLLGQSIQEEKIIINGTLNKKYDFSDLPKGIYFLNLKGESINVAEKFIIK